MRIPSSLSLLILVAPVAAQHGWSAPVPIAALNTVGADTGAHISPDGLTMHWASSVSGNWEIYSATRTARGAPWGAPVLETVLSDPTAVDSEPFLSADGLTIYFASQRPGGTGSTDIMRATRPNPTAPWGQPTFVTELNSSGADAAPAVTEDELEIYFLTTGWNAPNPPQNAIAVAKRQSTALPFGTPQIVAELASPNTHRDVFISPDGLRILYSEADPATRGIRIYQAVRTSRTSPFGPPTPVPEFDSIGSSGPYSIALTRDGNEAVLAGVASVGSQELFESRFDGLTTEGVPSLVTAVTFYYRDSNNPGRTYALALALGNSGFPLGSRQVPIDPDPLFIATFGVGVPPVSSGFLGVLDPQGQAVATLSNPVPALIGLDLWAGAFTLAGSAPFGVQTISNAVPVELQ